MKFTKEAMWPSSLAGFSFMVDLSRIPKSKRLEIIRKLQEQQKKIAPIIID